MHLQVQLHGRAGRFGRDGVEVGGEVIGCHGVASRRIVPRDVEPYRLPAGAHHLLVEHRVPLIGGHGLGDEMAALKGGQDPDDGQLRAAVQRLCPRHGELVEELALQVPPLVAGKGARRQVEFEVPAAEFGLELRGPDGAQDISPCQ